MNSIREVIQEISKIESAASAHKTYEVGIHPDDLVEAQKLAKDLLVEAQLDSLAISNIENKTTFFNAPASPMKWSFHSNFPGGLVLHSLLVTKELAELSLHYEVFKEDPRTILRIGLLHDMCKGVYNQPPDEHHKAWWYKRPMFEGHGDLTLVTLPTLGITLNEKETTAIYWHMGAFNVEKDGLRFYDTAKKKYPKEVLVTHWADMAAANFHEWSAAPVSEEEETKHE